MARWVVGVLLLVAGSAMAVPVQILATGDMHSVLKGRMMDGYLLGGPAAMFGYWKAREGYAPNKFLVLSTGDNVSGQAGFTMLEGEPDIEVMNAMGFQASAINTHEFDFGRGQLLRMAAAAKFPLLAANLHGPDGQVAEVAKPYVLIDTQGVKVGVVGLITRAATQPNLGLYTIGEYDPALRAAVAEARAKGAQVIVVIASLSDAELAALARATADLHLPLMFAGGTHEYTQQFVPESGTWVMSNGAYWAGYGRIDLDVDLADGSARVEAIKQVRLQQRTPALDPALQEIVARWQQKLGPDYNKPLGTAAGSLLRVTSATAFTLHCWLVANPAATFAMINTNGIRQDLPAGPITRADIINALPFDDKLYRIKMTGKQLLEFKGMKNDTVSVNDLATVDGKVMNLQSNLPLDPATTYAVILCDYLYNTSDYLRACDPAPVTVSPDWRLPLYQWLADHPTTAQKPLEKTAAMTRVSYIGASGYKGTP